ncbi:hypothetical protein ACFYWS_20370 [Streptomyces sp. NPDC002795]|uniref:hypothetical protein n=1 Tax=Streptomyces sp. NPDC002795 TaxID=3364665 RepID=UPI0036936518
MALQYKADEAADPQLFERLMVERYGPLAKLLSERRARPRTSRNDPMPSNPDPDAERHCADLLAALDGIGVEAAIAKQAERTPPYPGAVWCEPCESWCTPQGICGCNNR